MRAVLAAFEGGKITSDTGRHAPTFKSRFPTSSG
jgi:hypothetical protein